MYLFIRLIIYLFFKTVHTLNTMYRMNKVE